MDKMPLTEPENLGLLILLVAIAFSGMAIYRMALWVRAAPMQPDPWGDELEKTVHEPEAFPVCHHCFTPCPPHGWFCENCGCAVGPYNNYMPYVHCFSEGEVFRNGVTARLPRNALTVCGYVLISFSYLMLAPIYWIFLIKNLTRVGGELNMEKPG
jgi:hypothetical protein